MRILLSVVFIWRQIYREIFKSALMYLSGVYIYIVNDHLITLFARSHDKFKIILYPSTTMLVTTRLGRVGIYIEEFPSINLHNPLITWSCKITWNTRYVISLLQQGLWPLNFLRWWNTIRTFHLQNYTNLWIRGHLMPHDKLKTLYPLTQGLLTPNLAGLLHSMRSFPP